VRLVKRLNLVLVPLALAMLLHGQLVANGDPEPLDPCTLTVPRGSTVRLVAWYAHEWPRGLHWRSEDTWTNSLVPVLTVRPSCEGHPIGYQWYLDDALAKTCGVIPPPRWVLFADGFETGDTSQWSDTMP
jgi:hypothetical protein